MNQRENKNVWLQYGIAFVACAIATFIYVIARGIFSQTDTKEIYKYIIDGFFTVGILCACFGGIVMIANAGGFDIFAYGFMRFFSLFKKNPNDVKYKTFFDYRVAQAEKEHESKWFMVIVGGIYIGISIIFVFVWYGL